MRDLIVFGEDFGGLPSSTQHLITRLADDRKVLWVNSIGLRQPRLNIHDIKRALGKLVGRGKSGYQAAQPLKDNITVVNVKTIPAPRSIFARAMAKSMLLTQLRPIVKELKMARPILWSSLPTTADLCGGFNESAVVYYCGDDFSALAGVDHQVVNQHEQALVAQADIILAASPKLCQKFPMHKTHLLSHGVDLSLFQTPTTPARDLPNNGKPTAGFYGSLSNWLDYNLLQQLCTLRTDWNFVFIGPQEIAPCPLPSLPNVYYLGPKAHSELPSYSQHWQASLLPFVANDQIASCSPLKLMEYLAAGQPVVSTYFPALKPFQENIHLAYDVAQFSTALTLIEQNQSRVLPAHLEQESWDNRSHHLSKLLESL